MKTSVKSIFLVTVLLNLIALNSLAEEGGHGHSHAKSASSTSEVQATEIAVSEIKKLVSEKKLESSWGSISKNKATQAGTAKDWVVQFTDATAKDATKKNLYVIVSTSGEVKAVNFKGIEKKHSHGSGPAHSH